MPKLPTMAMLFGKRQKFEWLGDLVWPACLGWASGEEIDPLLESVWGKGHLQDTLRELVLWSSVPHSSRLTLCWVPSGLLSI